MYKQFFIDSEKEGILLKLWLITIDYSSVKSSDAKFADSIINM